MRHLKILTVLSVFILSISTGAVADSGALIPVKVLVEPSHIFLPTGFDTNDNTQLVVAGEFPNTCLKAGKLQAQVDKVKQRIVLRQDALEYGGCWCATLPVPYFQSVDLGILPSGKYEVFVEGRAGLSAAKGILPINVAKTSAPDDFFYAPVDEASIDTKGPNPVLTLKGTFASDCMGMQEVRVVKASNNVLEVLPITDLKEGAVCNPNPREFESQVDLPRGSGKTLVHIRALSGKAINKVVDL